MIYSAPFPVFFCLASLRAHAPPFIQADSAKLLKERISQWSQGFLASHHYDVHVLSAGAATSMLASEYLLATTVTGAVRTDGTVQWLRAKVRAWPHTQLRHPPRSPSPPPSSPPGPGGLSGRQHRVLKNP